MIWLAAAVVAAVGGTVVWALSDAEPTESRTPTTPPTTTRGAGKGKGADKVAIRGRYVGPLFVFVGRTGAGKSSVINVLASDQVAAVGDVASTTRAIWGYPVDGLGGQATLVDTPGIGEAHTHESYRDEILGWLHTHRNSIAAIVLVVAADGKAHADDVQLIVDASKSKEFPLIVALNQVDKLKPVREELRCATWGEQAKLGTAKSRHIAEKIGIMTGQLSELGNSKVCIPVCAERSPGFNVAELSAELRRIVDVRRRRIMGLPPE